jgi:hypothetical protein
VKGVVTSKTQVSAQTHKWTQKLILWMYETKCLNTKTHGRAYGNRALSEHIYGIWLWVLFGEGLVYPNSPQKNKKTVCNRHAHHDDVIEKQLKLNPASALKKTCHPRGFNKFIPKTS